MNFCFFSSLIHSSNLTDNFTLGNATTTFLSMAESLFFSPFSSRTERYEALYPQLEALIATESDLIANLANVAAALKEAFGFFWVGFYLVKEGQLVLGPFQGPIACTRIPFHKGVCGACYTQQEVILVPDVDQFPGHIACSSASRSEVVVPVFHRNGTVAMVLDVDSDQPDDFSKVDSDGLQKLMKLIERKL
jgi:L-methionine (R)-S-oxide reductase